MENYEHVMAKGKMHYTLLYNEVKIFYKEWK